MHFTSPSSLSRIYLPLFTLIVVIVVASGFGFADDSEPRGNIDITHGPVLQAPGLNEITVTWHTSREAISEVRYGEGDELDKRAVASTVGLIPNNSTCQAVRLTGLTPGKTIRYQLVSKAFRGYKNPYMPMFGKTVESEIFTYTHLDPAKEKFSFVMWNDIHDDCERLEAMFKDVDWEGVDFVVMNGDIVNDFISEKQFFDAFYDACARQFGSSIPMVFVRGNHETRGPWARRYFDYVPAVDGRSYYAFSHGGVYVLALDSGEDKVDDHREYAGLVDFVRFRDEETAWLLDELKRDACKEARYRVVISHQPCATSEKDWFGSQEVRRLWRDPINETGAHLWLSGHTHRFSWCKPGEDGDNHFHLMTNPTDGTVRVDVSPEAMQITVIRKGGEIIHKETISP
jgi:predicted phosphodiesterase